MTGRVAKRVVAVLAALALAAGCTDDDVTAGGPGAGVAASGPGGGEGDGNGAGTSTTLRPAADEELVLATVAEVPEPIALATRPGTGELHVASRGGVVRRLTPGAGGSQAWQVQAEPVLDIASEVSTDGERGLLGIAFDPDGSTLFVSYTDLSGRSVLESVAVGPATADPATRRVLLVVEQPFANHNGGHVAVGPDGMLWWGLGDGGGAGDPHGTGQDPSDLLGSMLRIDPDTDDGAAYRIPPDNPFASGGPGAPEVWLWGLRNPWRFSFDPATGDLWVGDVGQDRWEEVDVLRAGAGWVPGANLGWDAMEGGEPFEGGQEPQGHHPPVHVYANDGGRCAVTGGVVYRGELIPSLDGLYVFGDLCSGELLALDADAGPGGGDRGALDLGVTAAPGQLVSFGQDHAGEVYVLELGGRVARLEPAP